MGGGVPAIKRGEGEVLSFGIGRYGKWGGGNFFILSL